MTSLPRYSSVLYRDGSFALAKIGNWFTKSYDIQSLIWLYLLVLDLAMSTVRKGPASVFGKIGKVLGTSDVALFKLEAGLKYSDTTFSSEDYKVSPFLRRIDPATLPRTASLFINSPFNGLSKGNCQTPQIYTPWPSEH